MANTARLLICHDGSEGSDHAVDEASRLFPGAHATLAHVSRPPLPYGGVPYGGQIILPAEIQREIETRGLEQAEAVTTAAAERAGEAGLVAEVDVRATTGPVWRALLAAAAEADADVIVAGSRGFGEVKGLLLGSTSQALAHQSPLPLLIVPSDHS
jgi:nucleotide-binding universal stress UspA family protein